MSWCWSNDRGHGRDSIPKSVWDHGRNTKNNDRVCRRESDRWGSKPWMSSKPSSSADRGRSGHDEGRWF